MARLLQRLPDQPLHRLAHAAGLLLYWLQPVSEVTGLARGECDPDRRPSTWPMTDNGAMADAQLAIRASPTGAQRRRSIRGRLSLALLPALSALLRHLPDRSLHRLAHAAGLLLYALRPRRRRLVRANLGRVMDYLHATGMVARATDERALARLVRAAFGHYVRAYLESLIIERYAGPALGERLTADDPALVERVFGEGGGHGRPLLLVGLHFGAIEIPALWATAHGIRLTSPMETLDDPDLQAFLLHRRGASGLTLIPTTGAHRELSARLADGEGVAIVADRLVGGTGARVELFGAPARLPIGPAVLVLESGAPAWAVATRRTAPGAYRTRLEPIELPAEGTRRERLAGFMANQVRAYERLIADAPEQWWTLFFPIWSDTRQ